MPWKWLQTTATCLPSGFHHHWLLHYFWVSAENFFFDEYIYIHTHTHTHMCVCVGGWCGWRGTRSLTHFRVGPIPSRLWGILMGRSYSTQPYLIVAKIHSWVKAWHSETLTVTAPQREDDCSSKQNKQNHWGRAGRVTKKRGWGWGG